jgi:hypothetical protein
MKGLVEFYVQRASILCDIPNIMSPETGFLGVNMLILRIGLIWGIACILFTMLWTFMAPDDKNDGSTAALLD